MKTNQISKFCILLIFICFVVLPISSWADAVIVENGVEYKGQIIKETPETITLKSPGGNYYLPVKDIQTINGNSFDPNVDYVNMPAANVSPDTQAAQTIPPNTVPPIEPLSTIPDQSQQVIQNNPAPVTDNSSSTSRQTYSNDKYKISFSVPEGFDVSDGNTMSGISQKFRNPICIMGPPSHPVILVSMEILAKNLVDKGADGLLDFLQQEHNKRLQGWFTKTEESQVTALTIRLVGDKQVIYMESPSTQAQRVSAYILPVGPVAYYFYIMGEQDSNLDFLNSKVEEVISTVKTGDLSEFYSQVAPGSGKGPVMDFINNYLFWIVLSLGILWRLLDQRTPMITIIVCIGLGFLAIYWVFDTIYASTHLTDKREFSATGHQ